MQGILGAYTSKLRTTLIVLGVLLSGLVTIFGGSQSVSAVAPIDNMSLDSQIKSLLYYRALGNCLQNSGLIDNGVYADRINETNANLPKWFGFWSATYAVVPTPNITDFFLGPYLGKDAQDTRCSDDVGSSMLKDALSIWGYSKGVDALCSFGFLRVDYNDPNKCTDSQGGGGKDFYRTSRSDSNSSFQGSVKGKVYDGKDPYVSDAAWYKFYWTVFSNTCGFGKMSGVSKDVATGDYGYTLKQVSVNSEGRYVISNLYVLGVMKKTDNVDTRQQNATSNDKVPRTCQQIADHISNYAIKYQNYMVFDSQRTKPVEGNKDGCNLDGSCPPTNDQPTSCNIPNLGWILCPILTTGASLADGMYSYLVNSFLLPTDPSLVNTDPTATSDNGKLIGTGTYTAWKAMQGFGNIAFIIVFLIIIFSQLTNLGVSNFGIKRLLPRLIMAAILVNLSFLICQLAVDLSNILGYGLKGLFTGIADQINTTGVADTTSNDGNILGVLVGATIIGSLVWINIGALVVAVVGGIVALFTIFVLLIARKALIVLLIAIAPIAFVAYLLPNTEPMFHRWRKTLTSLLMLYPVIGALYGACILAAAVIKQVAGDDPTMNIAAYIILVVPLVAAIPLLKGSLSAVGAVGNAINNLGSRTSKSLGGAAGKRFDESRAGQFRKYRGQERSRHRALSRSGIDRFRGGNKNPLNWGKATQRGLNKASGKFGSNLSASGAELAAGIEREQSKAAETLLRSQITRGSTTSRQALDKAIRSGDVVQAKAAQNVLFSQGSSGIKDFHDSVVSAQQGGYANRNSIATLRSNITENHGQVIKTKAADISKWAGLGGNLTDHTKAAATWSGMSQTDLSGQTGDSLTRGAIGGLIDRTVAADLLDNGQLNGNLDDKQKAALNYAAGRGPAPTSPPSTPGSTPFNPGGPAPTSPPSTPGSTPFNPMTDDSEFTVPRVSDSDLSNMEIVEINRRRSEAGLPPLPDTKQQRPMTGNGMPTMDDLGRQTPPGADDDYHDGMTK